MPSQNKFGLKIGQAQNKFGLKIEPSRFIDIGVQDLS